MIELGHLPEGNYVESNQAIYWDGKTDTGETVTAVEHTSIKFNQETIARPIR